MKRVRFESPKKCVFTRMDDSECHSPRPFIEKRAPTQVPNVISSQRVVYSNDPVHRFEYSDSSPYPLAKKTFVPFLTDSGPSSDLNLSMLDIHEPRPLCKSFSPIHSVPKHPLERTCTKPNVLSAIENVDTPPNVLCKDSNFFLRKDNIDINPLQTQFKRLSFNKENAPLAKKAELMKTVVSSTPNLPVRMFTQPQGTPNVEENLCSCHHCVRVITPQPIAYKCPNMIPPKPVNSCSVPTCHCQVQIPPCNHYDHHKQPVIQGCTGIPNTTDIPATPQNAVDKKNWAIEKYESSKNSECKDIEKQTSIAKEKREPTISDLLKIIKLQNEQLQLLQEKVDKFITVSNQQKVQQIPVQNYMTEHVALQTIDSEHKISIGVMTSFEMVRTSTVINKEVVKKTTENAQIQCNRSHISIKEVVSKQPVNLNFLDGIMPVGRAPSDKDISNDSALGTETVSRNTTGQQSGNNNEDKTLNEMSLYNVQVDNATTPLMSPEQSLYLDVRDYSDSESNSDDQSNVGWTYYNKVMTTVNGLLEDSEMPSSASALCRNTRRQCVQMQFDKTNVSVTKRVKFGDDPVGVQQQYIYTGSTDTSLKMNQLAAKYLKSVPSALQHEKPTPIDMSFATRNYMERHKLLQGYASTSRSPPPGEMPRFLDITALKQQPKLL